MGNCEGIEVLRPGLVLDLGAAVLELHEFEPEVMHERDVDAELHVKAP
jgi:hypothetical protein